MAPTWTLWRLPSLTCGDSPGSDPPTLVREFHEHPTKNCWSHRCSLVRLATACNVGTNGGTKRIPIPRQGPVDPMRLFGSEG